MITGVHAIVFSPEAEKVRGFFSDTLGFASVDAGGGWPIYAMHPRPTNPDHHPTRS